MEENVDDGGWSRLFLGLDITGQRRSKHRNLNTRTGVESLARMCLTYFFSELEVLER